MDRERHLEDMRTCMYVLDLLGWSSTTVDDADSLATRYERVVDDVNETVTIFADGDATGSRSIDRTVIHEISGSASYVVMEAYEWSR